MTRYIANIGAVKVSVGSERGNSVAIIAREGEVIPEGVDETLIASLLERGLIVELDEPTEQEPAELPSDSWNHERIDAWAAEQEPAELPSDSWNHERIDAWAAEQEPPIELVDPGTSKQFVKADKLAQIAAQLEARKTQQ